MFSGMKQLLLMRITNIIKGEMVMGYATKDDNRKVRTVWAKGDKDL